VPYSAVSTVSLRRDLELLAKSEKESDKATYREMLSALRKLIRDVDGKPA
jgi:hypothetical protein